MISIPWRISISIQSRLPWWPWRAICPSSSRSLSPPRQPRRIQPPSPRGYAAAQPSGLEQSCSRSSTRSQEPKSTKPSRRAPDQLTAASSAEQQPRWRRRAGTQRWRAAAPPLLPACHHCGRSSSSSSSDARMWDVFEEDMCRRRGGF